MEGELDPVTSQRSEKVRGEILNLLVEGKRGGFAYVWYVCISEFSHVYLPSLNYKHFEETYSSHH